MRRRSTGVGRWVGGAAVMKSLVPLRRHRADDVVELGSDSA